ncbi:unnamed protein product [Arabidopsis thaliana]|uniref:(thale cress) hypothetical protein n=1 Tax=Arabidopsis thaliana TaxID=3702 RepID=A0A7G2FBT8_ARATH|nr:unnamed protein product [Arabidopsis thaliana]
MSLVLHDPDLVGDVDSEAEERDEFHMEELLKEWTDEPPIRHDMYPESDDEEKTERFDTDIRHGDGYLYDKDKIGFICVGCDGKKGGAKCEWKIYAAILPSDNMWKIRKFVDTYSCIPNGECEMFKVPHIARLFVDKIRDSPEFYMPTKIEEIIREQWKISVTRNQCQSARKKALQWIEKEYDDQFARLRDYAAEILEANKDSRVEVECLMSDDGKDMFNRDANNRIYPIAWGVVKVENTDNWVWFMKLLKEDFRLSDGEGFIMISDRQKHLEKIRCYDTKVYESVMKTKPRSWVRAFQKIGSFCEDVDNNSVESFNGSLNKAREKPFVAMLETIRRMAMVRIAKRSVESHTHTGVCTPYVTKFLAGEHKVAAAAKVSPSTNGMYEVRHGGDLHRVNLQAYTCTCIKWQICGIPCEHAYSVIIHKKLEPENFVCCWFRTAMWRKNYTDGLFPQRGPKFWPESNGLRVYVPPPTEGEEDKKMTKAEKKRKKGVNESPTKKQPKGKKRIMHCGVCGAADHNSRHHKKDKASISSSQLSQPEPSQGSLTQT